MKDIISDDSTVRFCTEFVFKPKACISIGRDSERCEIRIDAEYCG